MKLANKANTGLIVRWIAISFSAIVVVVIGAAIVDLRQAYARIADASTVIASPYGAIEFKRMGSGPPVLVVHGSGGGYDQGELIAQAVLGKQFQWITPSRFGYLRSTFQEGATFEDQARAYAHLLDTLGLNRVAVVAMSHGGPSALLFAALYPDRVSSLTLLSCGVASSTANEQASANQKGSALTRIFQYDLLYWFVSNLLRDQLMELMGANKTAVNGLTAEQQQLIERLIDYMNPVAPRAAGVLFDNRAALPNERIAAIRSPTLVVHAKDDTLQLYRNAEYALATIPGSRLLSFDKGGHLVVAVEQLAIQTAVQQFILANP